LHATKIMRGLRIRIRRVVGVNLTIASVALSACGVDTCQNSCLADPVLNAEQLSDCQNPNRKAPCYAEARAFADCATPLRVCRADGRTDAAAWKAKTDVTCQKQGEAYAKCLSP
jgi:hypothetical protein